MYEPINDIMEIIGTLRNTKFKCKICEKEIIEKTNFKMHMKMSIEDLKDTNVMLMAKISLKI